MADPSGSRSGIRTRETFQPTRFRGGRFRPLSHPTWQRVWDSNPRGSLPNRLAFQASAFVHSANSLGDSDGIRTRDPLLDREVR